jgi:hypothetical protein
MTTDPDSAAVEVFDPFAGIEDLPESTSEETRIDLFHDARRGFVRIRKDFVQKESGTRGDTVLAKLVSGHKERALDALLTVHALQPILRDSSLPLAVWARLLNCTPRSAGAALKVLESMGVLELSGTRVVPEIILKRENGDGKPWSDVAEGEREGRGFFTIPFDFWTSGTIDSLGMAGKAMFLILLKETQDPNAKRRTFVMANERAQDWYGISERTAERGYKQLRNAGILLEKSRLVPSARHPLGRSEEWHRVLSYPYSSDHREALRLLAQNAAQGIDATSSIKDPA